MHEIRAAVLRGSRRLSYERVGLDGPKRDEVLVDVRATGVCHTDFEAYADDDPDVPVVLGHEGAGVVDAVGENVSTVSPGDRVVLWVLPTCGDCRYCRTGRPVLCQQRRETRGRMLDGTRRLHAAGEPLDHFYAQSSFATGAVVHERSAIPVPESLPYSVGALLGCSASTGVGAVRNVAGVESGQSVAVFGCGGVGASAILAADATSADPIVAVDVVPEKLDRMVALGATHVVDATEEDPVERVQDIAGGVEYALECSGSPRTIRQAHGSLRPGGTTVVTVTSSTGPVELDAGRFASGTSLVGNPVGAIRPSVDIPRYARMYRNDALDLDLLLSRTYELEELDEAFRALEAGEVIRSAIRFEE